MTKPIPP
jgi:hypothetical protein